MSNRQDWRNSQTCKGILCVSAQSPHALYNRRTKQSLPCLYTGFRVPLVRRGLRSALIRHISSHDKMSRIVMSLFLGKARKNHVVIRHLFVVNRDKKNHDSRQKDDDSCLFFSLGMALSRWSLIIGATFVPVSTSRDDRHGPLSIPSHPVHTRTTGSLAPNQKCHCCCCHC